MLSNNYKYNYNYISIETMRYVNSHIPHKIDSIWISVVVLVLLKSQLRDLIHFPQACLVLDLQMKN